MMRLATMLISIALLAATHGVGEAADPLTNDPAAFLAREKALYSLEHEETLIRHFFADRRDGFYVDIGCFDYKDRSTTYYLEKHLGWTGIGIDAEERHRTGWEKHRPRSKFFAYAITDKSGETITFLQAGGLSTTEIDTTNLEKWQQVRKFEPKKITVPTITIDDLLDREGVKTIDFLSMDINGAEPVALAGFDIERFKPALVHVEASAHRHDELRAYFAKHGYVRIDAYLEYDKHNWYFTPKP